MEEGKQGGKERRNRSKVEEGGGEGGREGVGQGGKECDVLLRGKNEGRKAKYMMKYTKNLKIYRRVHSHL